MTGALAVAMVAVGLWCAARAVVPRLGPRDHRRDLDAWHGLMAGAMAAMLLLSSTRALAMVGLVAFAVGVAWALVRLAARVSRAAYLRLGVACAAMAVMLLPTATATATAAARDAADAGHAGHAHGAHVSSTAGTGTPGIEPPLVLLVGLLLALGAVVVVRVVGLVGARSTLPTRLDACCEALMAAVMGYMLVTMV